jgi:hypothetical protein
VVLSEVVLGNNSVIDFVDRSDVVGIVDRIDVVGADDNSGLHGVR